MVTFFFFLGILLSIRALDTAGILLHIEQWLSQTRLTPTDIAIALGLASAVVDNVPLVAASLGMYSPQQFQPDSSFWQLLAYCAGVGGSILIIGSPAGIAYMNLERVSFIWYMRKLSFPILVGFFAGVGAYYLQMLL